MASEWRAFVLALAAMTRLPVPGIAAHGTDGANRVDRADDAHDAAGGAQPVAAATWPADSLRHFPAAGLCIGALGALVLWCAAHAWPALLAVLLAMAASTWLTRALHERGLAAGSDALTLLFVLALKAAALQGLAVRDLDAALVLLPLAHTWSRTAGVLALRLLNAPDAPPVDGHTLAVALMWAGVMAVAAVSFVPSPLLLLAALAVLGVTVLAGRWLQQRRGLQVTALFGVLQQDAELAVYLAVLAGMARG